MYKNLIVFTLVLAMVSALTLWAQATGSPENVTSSDGKAEKGKTMPQKKPTKKTKAAESGYRVRQTSGDLTQITLTFSDDPDPKEAKRPSNYEIIPADVEQLRVVAVGKLVNLSGLRLKKGKKYRIKIAPAVKDAKGRTLKEAGREVEFTPVYEKRRIRVSAIQPLRITEWKKHYSEGDKGVAGYLEYIEEMVDEAGRMGSDIVCLPEHVPTLAGTQPIPGPYFNRLARKARKFSMYVIAHVMEKEKGVKKPRPTAFIIDRQGKLLGKYRKVHLTEGARRGQKPGDTFPVFQTDFGKIGIQICFDIIAFSESIRLLALNGAEIVFFPHATGSVYERDIVLKSRAMAMENCLYMVPCHYGRLISGPDPVVHSGSFGRTSVIGPDGLIISDAGTDPGIASAVIDLEKKRLGHGWGYSGVNDIRHRAFKYRRPSIYGGLTEEK